MNTNDFYKLKYQKYKNKYINLKNNNFFQEGGTDKNVTFYILVNKEDYNKITRITIDDKKNLEDQDFFYKNKKIIKTLDLENISFLIIEKGENVKKLLRTPVLDKQEIQKFEDKTTDQSLQSIDLNNLAEKYSILKENLILQINFNCRKLLINKLLSYFFWKYDQENFKIVQLDEEVITYFIKLNDDDEVDYEKKYTYNNGLYSSEKVALPFNYWDIKIVKKRDVNSILNNKKILEEKSFFIYNDTKKTIQKSTNKKYKYDGIIYNFITQNKDLLETNKITKFLTITYSFFNYDRRHEMKGKYIIFFINNGEWYPKLIKK